MIADHFDGFVLDLDGVVYVGDRAVPGAVEAIQALRARGKRILFLTNDPRGSREEYAAKLRRLGVPAERDDVLTAGAATAMYLRQHEAVEGRAAFVIGTGALKAEIAAAGLRLVGKEEGREADVVVVGLHEGFDYHELRVAVQAVARGAGFYATNRDASFPMPDGPWPATGAVVTAVETASGRRAVAVGKPERFIFDLARDLLKPCRRLVVVGDRLDSDVAGGRAAGLATVLVLSGSTRAGDLDGAPFRPDFVVPSLAAVVLRPA